MLTNKTFPQKVNLLNDIILSILKNFVPDEFITCDDRDPTRIKDNIKIKSNGKIVCRKIVREKTKKLSTMSY